METSVVCESCQNTLTLCICVLALPPIHNSLVSVASPPPRPPSPPAPVQQHQEEEEEDEEDDTLLLDASAPPMTDEVERELLVLLADANAEQHHLHLKLRICTASLYQLPLEDFFASLDPSVTSPQQFDRLCQTHDLAAVVKTKS